VPPLSPVWLRQADDGSVEFRLAASLASVAGRLGDDGPVIPLRRQLEPVRVSLRDRATRVRWDFEAGRDVVWGSGSLIHSLNQTMQRRLLMAQASGTSTYSDWARYPAQLGDIADFIDLRTDDQRIAKLLWGCILIDWPRAH